MGIASRNQGVPVFKIQAKCCPHHVDISIGLDRCQKLRREALSHGEFLSFKSSVETGFYSTGISRPFTKRPIRAHNPRCLQTSRRGFSSPDERGAQRRPWQGFKLKLNPMQQAVFLCAARARSFNGRAVREGFALPVPFSRSANPHGSAHPFSSGVAVLQSPKKEPIMASLSLRAVAPSIPPVSPRRRLAENVVCLFAEDRPPVVQPAARRVRYPDMVRRISSTPRLREGALCEIWKSGHPANIGLTVRLIGPSFDGDWLVEALFGRMIECASGNRRRRAACPPDALRRIVEEVRHV